MLERSPETSSACYAILPLVFSSGPTLITNPVAIVGRVYANSGLVFTKPWLARTECGGSLGKSTVMSGAAFRSRLTLPLTVIQGRYQLVVCCIRALGPLPLDSYTMPEL